MSNTIFPFSSRTIGRFWQEFKSIGFSAKVAGCIYEDGETDGGVPLGGLGTGYIALDSSAHLGNCSIFNDLVPPYKINSPFLALTCNGDSRVVSTLAIDGIRGSESIKYWGHYPVADLIIDTGLQVEIGIRAFAPLVLGDTETSNIPAALFEIALTNTGEGPAGGMLTFSFPGKAGQSLAAKDLYTKEGRYGVTVSEDNIAGYVLLTDDGNAQCGDALGTAELPWKDYCGNVPSLSFNSPGASVSVEYSLSAGEQRRYRFVLGWYYPYFSDSSGERHRHHYKRRFSTAMEVAECAFSNFDDILGKIIANQSSIYTSSLPLWLKDGLINSLYSLAKHTLWVISDRRDSWYPEIGFFTHNESFTGCPITETMVCRMHGHLPVLYFFPELERSTLSAFKHFQLRDGEVPFSFGMLSSLRDPRYQCQHPLNSGQYVQMVYRYYLRTGDLQFVEEFYDSVKDAVRYQQTLDYDGDGLVNEHAHTEDGGLWPANQFYDIWPWYGTSAYVAGTWLATLACARRIAEIVGDSSFAEECSSWLLRGQASYETKLWNGSYYRLYNDAETGRVSETSLANQLMAQWCVNMVGCEDVLPKDHIHQSLESVRRLNFAATRHGLVNGVKPDGFPDTCDPEGAKEAHILPDNDHASQIFIGENMCAAVTALYSGFSEFGIEVAKRLYEAVTIHHATPWNQRCLIHREDGRPVWGGEYYSNMVIWALPLAIEGKNIGDIRKEGLLQQMAQMPASEQRV